MGIKKFLKASEDKKWLKALLGFFTGYLLWAWLPFSSLTSDFYSSFSDILTNFGVTFDLSDYLFTLLIVPLVATTLLMALMQKRSSGYVIGLLVGSVVFGLYFLFN